MLKFVLNEGAKPRMYYQSSVNEHLASRAVIFLNNQEPLKQTSHYFKINGKSYRYMFWKNKSQIQEYKE